MSMMTLRIAVLALIAAATPARAEPCAAGAPLTMGVEDYAPYQMRDGAGWAGIDLEIARAVLREMGCELALTDARWRRQLHEIEAGGDIQFAPSAAHTADRETFARFSAPYRTGSKTLILAAGAPTPPDLEAVLAARQTFALARGHFFGDEGGPLLESYDFLTETVASLDIALRMVARERVAATIGDPFIVAYSARRMGVLSRLAITDVVVTSGDTHFLFSRRTVPAAVVAAFDATLTRLKREGVIAAIMEPWREGRPGLAAAAVER